MTVDHTCNVWHVSYRKSDIVLVSIHCVFGKNNYDFAYYVTHHFKYFDSPFYSRTHIALYLVHARLQSLYLTKMWNVDYFQRCASSYALKLNVSIKV